MTVHLVNLTNPMMMKGPFLVAGREVPVAQDGTRLSVTIPPVRDLKVVTIDL